MLEAKLRHGQTQLGTQDAQETVWRLDLQKCVVCMCGLSCEVLEGVAQADLET